MKIVSVLFLFISIQAKAATLPLDTSIKQVDLVVQDLEQIQNHGKKWQSKLKKATTTATKIFARRQIQNEG